MDVRTEVTLSQARADDARIGKGDATPLTGVPISHKDIFVTGIFIDRLVAHPAGYMSPFDATVSKNCRMPEWSRSESSTATSSRWALPTRTAITAT